MNKICTDIEQSQKLLELGIDVNTADMCWTNHLFNAFLSTMRIESTSPQEYKNLLDGFAVRGYLIEPAWSLSALLDVLPKHIKSNVLRIDINEKDFSIWYDEVGYGVNIELPDITMESAVDACYEFILKLHELKML